MVSDAEAHADDDRRLRDLADAKNSAESTIYQTEKLLAEHGDQVDGETRSSIESAVTALRGVIDGEEADTIRAREHDLKEASYKLAEVMYASAQSSDGGSAEGQAEPDEEVIEDAEIVEDPDAARS